MVQKVKKRLQRNPRRIANQMAKDLKISDRSIRRIRKNGLMAKPYMIQKANDPSPKQQQVRYERGVARVVNFRKWRFLKKIFLQFSKR